MPPQLSADWRRFQLESGRLEDLINSLGDISIRHRYLIAEIVMIRLFLLTENTVSSVCTKLVCRAEYLDGTHPIPIRVAPSMGTAQSLMKKYGRRRPKQYLKWTRAKDIRNNLKYTMDNNDVIFNVISNYAAIMDETRCVRNHIAHKSESSRRHFRYVIVRYFGGLKRGMSPGRLLLSSAIGPPHLLRTYLGYNRVFVKELVRA